MFIFIEYQDLNAIKCGDCKKSGAWFPRTESQFSPSYRKFSLRITTVVPKGRCWRRKELQNSQPQQKIQKIGNSLLVFFVAKGLLVEGLLQLKLTAQMEQSHISVLFWLIWPLSTLPFPTKFTEIWLILRKGGKSLKFLPRFVVFVMNRFEKAYA